MSKHWTLVLFAFSVVSSADYDPEKAISERLDIFRKTCRKYDDDLTYEYGGKKKYFNIKAEPHKARENGVIETGCDENTRQN
jgi:hypothetical protein